MKDLVSVIVLVNNIESFINVSIDSILKQTYKNIEVILVDRGSKDNTLKICEYYAKKDRRVKLVEVSSKTANFGNVITVTATGNLGYKCTSILVDGKAITGNTFIVSGNHTVTATFELKEVTFLFSLDTFSADGTTVEGGIGGEAKVTYATDFSVKSALTLGGWCSSTNGIKGWEYSVNGGTWVDAGAEIFARPDLTGTQYQDIETAGFSGINIPVSALSDGVNKISIRFIDMLDNEVEIIDFTNVSKISTYTISVGPDVIDFNVTNVCGWDAGTPTPELEIE